jgi:hypothetical protein
MHFASFTELTRYQILRNETKPALELSGEKDLSRYLVRQFGLWHKAHIMPQFLPIHSRQLLRVHDVRSPLQGALVPNANAFNHIQAVYKDRCR